MRALAFPLRFALIAAFALAAAACGVQPNSAPPRTWARDTATTYLETRGDGAAVARMSQASEIEPVLASLRGALGDERNARMGSERIGFILQYAPIWRADHIDTEQWNARRARIPMLPDADIGQWRAALQQAAGYAPTELWTIGYLIDTPSLFKDGAFDQARSALLHERLRNLSPEAIGLVSSTLRVERAWAAMLIVQNDAFFEGAGADINADRFASAVAALGQAVSPEPSATTQQEKQ